MLWKGSPKNALEAERTTSVQKPACARLGRASHDISSQPASQQRAGGDPVVRRGENLLPATAEACCKPETAWPR